MPKNHKHRPRIYRSRSPKDRLITSSPPLFYSVDLLKKQILTLFIVAKILEIWESRMFAEVCRLFHLYLAWILIFEGKADSLQKKKFFVE